MRNYGIAWRRFIFLLLKTCAARFMCAFGTFRLNAQTTYLRTFLCVWHACTDETACISLYKLSIMYI